MLHSLSDMTNRKMSTNIIYFMLFQTNYRQKEKQILDRILDQEVYDSRMRPTGINSTGLFLLSILIQNKLLRFTLQDDKY